MLTKYVFSLSQMDDGFTEAETLGLFAQVLNIRIDQLPPEAKKIHIECKGMPLLIAMFAAHFEEFKEDMIMTDGTRDRWKYYLQSLRKKDPKNKYGPYIISTGSISYSSYSNHI